LSCRTPQLSKENPMSNSLRVLILCTGNSARSQMAEGLIRHLSGGRYEVHSAGTHPTTVNPLAIKAMEEIGIDISDQWSKSVDEFRGEEFDYVITVCDNAAENCPVVPGKTKRVHWSFEDPAAAEGTETQRLEVFRRVRDLMHRRFSSFVTAPLLAIGADRVR
jgi:arsenate reductase (thioredoxin)